MVVTHRALFLNSAKTSRLCVGFSAKHPVSAFSVQPPAFSTAITFVRLSVNDSMPKPSMWAPVPMANNRHTWPSMLLSFLGNSTSRRRKPGPKDRRYSSARRTRWQSSGANGLAGSVAVVSAVRTAMTAPVPNPVTMRRRFATMVRIVGEKHAPPKRAMSPGPVRQDEGGY